jgi:5-hydroxytryptamine receptor 1
VLLCDVWTWADILCCSASILHLLAIALDRYWAVTCVTHTRQPANRRVLTLIALVWLLALLISVGPLLGWKDDQFQMRLLLDRRCSYSQELSYQLFATVATFYAPLFFILLLYYRIFQVSSNLCLLRFVDSFRDGPHFLCCRVDPSQTVRTRFRSHIPSHRT